MDLLNNLAVGFATALSLQNLLYCFLGVTLGTLIGVLPGLGPVATLAMLLPITYTLDPTSALIMPVFITALSTADPQPRFWLTFRASRLRWSHA